MLSKHSQSQQTS